MIEWKAIFKREKQIQDQMPTPKFEDNWKQEKYEQNVTEGVMSLQQLAEKISIDKEGSTIKIEIK